ncbi:hypothetical protein AXE80_10835 [Wenyingzhuangia fucanilytica]|uniref:Uncharacterized protein n=1 Tax=Wenyingzhuangia fucanilytica TaxID=1790137 RepID=A0A1B1Y7M6_9FLAO|nr:hypothetical protein [Wenyingzhuangia fucanilytica]ANW96739.1 hypothetical protein AXE80_10835 [Wenyingzhuangia fucanilytica]
MEAKIIKYFKTDRTFAGGKALYSQCANKNRSIERSLNTMTETPANIEMLQYQLWKLTGKNDRVRLAMINKPVQAEVKVVKMPTPSEAFFTKLQTAQTPEEASAMLADCPLEKEEALKLIEERIKALIPDEIIARDESIQNKRSDLLKALEESDELTKQSIKLREQFPFLKGKNYPDAYKILTADLVTAYAEYKENHKDLFNVTTEAERFEVAKSVVDPYKENKLIWEELEHFQAHGKPLGKHPIFKELAYKEELRNKSADDLSKRLTNVIGYINRNKAKAEASTGKKQQGYLDKVEQYTAEKAFIEALLKNRK